MKNLLKKLTAMSNQSEATRESSSSKGKKLNLVSFPRPRDQSEENKPFSAIAGWFHSVTNRKSSSPPSSSSSRDAERMEGSRSTSIGVPEAPLLDVTAGGFDTSISKHPVGNEEYQIQLAMELSAKEDPEATQIEAVKQISLGSYPSESDPAEVVAYRYWNHNALSYEDKILDGFYDIYGVFNDSASSKMPSLVDLQGMPPSEGVSLEVILVNRLADVNLLKLEKRAMLLANNLRSKFLLSVSIELVEELARLVANYMGGPIGDQGSISRAWKSLSYSLKSTLGSTVLPLGSLTIGLARHRALLFKVLADSVGIPCQLMKGQQYTGSDEVAMNTVRIDGGREFIVDLMADPGTLIPSDGLGIHVEYEEPMFSPSPLSRDVDSSTVGTSSSGGISSFEESSTSEAPNYKNRLNRHPVSGNEDLKPTLQFRDPSKMERERAQEFPAKASYPFSHFKSPSWSEGVSSPAAHQKNVKDVSQLVIDTAKGNPQFAQKLHDALLESGVATPPNLFSGICDTPSDTIEEAKTHQAHKEKYKSQERRGESSLPLMLPPLPQRGGAYTTEVSKDASYGKNVPFAAAAAAAAAAVVASSVVAAVAKSNADSNAEFPISAAATATAAAVVATAAAVGKQYEHLEACCSPTYANSEGENRSDGLGGNSEGERTSDRSVGTDSVRSEVSLDDVADCEIAWEEITVGERIGLGSYGEVYAGDWHGTGVAVKRFLDQDVYGETLEEFKSEVRMMRRLRHPNVVLFMGAVTHPPNLSIVTELLPRGSLYRLIHRPNNQLDERRRLRMAFDTARGMNYLHNCSPMIVHRDLKSPNLLVDRNWVVKVCDFGLSRIKQSTFLSTRSTAGTAEWMAPEVLRNEPSNEKCDVYSFGVILWELCTMRQPWSGMNPMQVVGAVGFQHRRLDIPEDIDPAIAEIIRKCWETEPRLRPSFAEIMTALKPFQKPSQASRPSQQTRSRQGTVG